MLKKALLSAMGSDLFVVLGSSLKVNPGYLIPLASNGKLVICNPEPTSLDHVSHLTIRAGVEEILCSLSRNLKLTVPKFL